MGSDSVIGCPNEELASIAPKWIRFDRSTSFLHTSVQNVHSHFSRFADYLSEFAGAPIAIFDLLNCVSTRTEGLVVFELKATASGRNFCRNSSWFGSRFGIKRVKISQTVSSDKRQRVCASLIECV